MTGQYPYEVRLPLAPYHFVWAASEPIDCLKRQTPAYAEECYRHEDGTEVVIRQYGDGSFHILSDRGPIEVADHARDRDAAQPISVVTLP